MMLNYDFLKIIDSEGYIRIYEDFSIPTIICDDSFGVHWSNTAAKTLYPHLTLTSGFRGLISEFDENDLLSRLEREGSCRISGAVAFSGVQLNLMRILHDNKVAGAIVMLVAPEAVVRPQDVLISSQTPAMLEKKVRRIVEDVFGTMDSASLKADMLEAAWIKPSFAAIAQSGYQLLRTVSNISHYTQYQAAAPELLLKPLDIFDLLREYERTSAGISAGIGVPIRFELPENAGFAGINEDKFMLAFFNVLHNSLYFTKPDNSVEITGSYDEKAFTVTVRDHGVGIAADVLPHIFRPYFSAGHDGGPAGIGLGLPVAKTIIEAHGGVIGVQSKVNDGTKAVITIPKGIFSRRAAFAQGRLGRSIGEDRFSRVYVGLSDAACSPYREK